MKDFINNSIPFGIFYLMSLFIIYYSLKKKKQCQKKLKK